VARIDAHLLNRQGVARLCYCGPVLHTRPDRPHATREPLQFGAEIYGHAGLEADLEILQLALDCLRATKVEPLTLDMADARIVRSLLSGTAMGNDRLAALHAALATKDATELGALTRDLPQATREALLALIGLYGDAQVLAEAARVLPPTPGIRQGLEHLQWLAGHVEGARVSFDLADLRGYAYYSGVRFGIYTPGASDALVRGGRYDEVGAVFGRNRPAVGFSLDVRELVGVAEKRPLKAAIRAPWPDTGPGGTELRAAIAALRHAGEVVVCALPGHDSEVEEFHCDRELARDAGGRWAVRSL
jgi:ATP phosphoribosyltransferase regulatory subunit